MCDYSLYWLRDSLGYFQAGAHEVLWGFRCLWWALLSAGEYVWYIKILRESG